MKLIESYIELQFTAMSQCEDLVKLLNLYVFCKETLSIELNKRNNKTNWQKLKSETNLTKIDEQIFYQK